MEDASSYIPEFDTRQVLSGYSTYNANERLRVKFYLREILNEVRTAETGTEQFDYLEYCEIPIPGSKEIWDQPVRDIDIKRFPEEYARFKAGQKGLDLSNVTVLKDWAPIDPAKYNELVAEGFLTVEEVANCPDSSIGKLGANGVSLRKQAQAFMANKAVNSNDGRIKKLEKENQDLQEQMRQLIEMNKEALSRLAEKEGTKKGK
jgi:hypothetical protein